MTMNKTLERKPVDTRLSRQRKFNEAMKKWDAFIRRPGSPFLIDEIDDQVTRFLHGIFKQRMTGYLEGSETLRAVYEAYNNYAKAHRLPRTVRQLGGEIFDSPQRKTAVTIHREFQLGGDSQLLRREKRTCVTPQVEMQSDQLERATVYFGFKSGDDYVRRQTILRIDD